MPELTSDRLALGLTTYVVLLFSLSVHESAHAWMAHKLGDDTALREGRVSLNPLVHIDPIGTVLFPLLQIFTGLLLIGWAKPTPYDPTNFRRDVTMRSGHMLVAGAGPVSNLLLAVLFTVAFFVIVRTGIIEDARNPIVMMVGHRDPDERRARPLQPRSHPAPRRVEGRLVRAAGRRSGSATIASWSRTATSSSSCSSRPGSWGTCWGR